MTSVNQWRVYCNTEATWVYGFLDTSLPAPTKCFNDTTHDINPNSVNITETISPNSVQIIQSSINTGNNYKLQGFSYNISNVNSSQTFVLSWPYPICLLSADIQAQNQTGDTIDVIVAPNTVIGTTTSSINSGVNVIPVSSTVITNVKTGYEIILVNGNTSQNLGEIYNIDIINSTISAVNSSSTSFPSGSIVETQIRRIKNMCFGGDYSYHIGGKSLIGSPLPANTNVSIIYTNNSSSPKTLTFQIEYFY